MAEYIEREKTIKHIQKTYCADCNSYNGVRCRACGTGDAIDMIEDAPAADVAPVRHGRWIDIDGDPVPWDKYSPSCPLREAYCSECGEWLAGSDEYPVIGLYCPKCGAKMDLEADHEVSEP